MRYSLVEKMVRLAVEAYLEEVIVFEEINKEQDTNTVKRDRRGRRGSDEYRK